MVVTAVAVNVNIGELEGTKVGNVLEPSDGNTLGEVLKARLARFDGCALEGALESILGRFDGDSLRKVLVGAFESPEGN